MAAGRAGRGQEVLLEIGLFTLLFLGGSTGTGSLDIQADVGVSDEQVISTSVVQAGLGQLYRGSVNASHQVLYQFDGLNYAAREKVLRLRSWLSSLQRLFYKQ